MKPTGKVTAGAFAGAVAGLVVWVANEHFNAGMGAEQGVMVSVVFTFLVQWVMGNAR